MQHEEEEEAQRRRRRIIVVTERMANEKTKESLSRKKNTAFPRALATNGNQRPLMPGAASKPSSETLK
jgi:E3 ubiquitin-protein ligase DOA10